MTFAWSNVAKSLIVVIENDGWLKGSYDVFGLLLGIILYSLSGLSC